MNEYLIGVSRDPWPRKPAVGSREWGQLGRSYVNRILSVTDLALTVSTQHVVCPWLKKPWRTTENYLGSSMVGVDWDAGDISSDIDTILKIPMVRMYGGVAYQTQSSTLLAPRCRVLFLLDKPNYSPAKQRQYNRALAFYMNADLAATDCSRAFYGAGDSGRVEVLGREIETAFLDDLVQSYEEDAVVRPASAWKDIPPSLQELADLLRRIDYETLPDGTRHECYYRCAAAVYSVAPGQDGLALVQSWVPRKSVEAQKNWTSFRSRPPTLTIGTLYYYIQESNGKK